MFEKEAVQPPLLISKAVIFGTQHGLAPRIKHNPVMPIYCRYLESI